ncbi:MAG: epimerase [Candidatus Pacebacteria bacterium CG10_big_fil_rev_8_21_14_0_10_40_26]|nr:MAG: epimerase [Candidatus Pacebacteria bacterium CG10_big_fil_rev_8_21_14_0_10_40_26]
MKKTYIVTGCAGFIGSHISEALIADRNNSVIGIDNFNDYYSPKIKESNIQKLLTSTQFKLHKIDLKNTEKVEALIKRIKPDFIIHCAGMAGVRNSIQNLLTYTQNNILATQNILEAIRISQLDTKIVLLSSSSVYGIQEKTPFVENMVANPSSPYGVSKFAMELLAKEYSNHYDMKIAIVRPFSIYGPRGRVDMAPFLIIKAAIQGKPFYQFGTNENKRDWTYIDDFVDGVTGLTKKWSFKTFEVFNLGNNTPVGIEDFISISKKLIGEKLNLDLTVLHKERGSEELPITFANIDKSHNLIGYTPKIKLEDGLNEFYTYFKKYRGVYDLS